MKRMLKISALIVVMLSFAAASFAQVSATATAAATIVTPITISKSADLDFGNVYVGALAGGTVTLDPATGNRGVGGTAGLPGVPGTVSRATFAVGGTVGAVYTITLPGGATTIGDGAGHSMLVNGWTSSPTPTGTLVGGASTLYIGATLNIAAAQATGTYSSAVGSGGSGDFTVTVNYQ